MEEALWFTGLVIIRHFILEKLTKTSNAGRPIANTLKDFGVSWGKFNFFTLKKEHFNALYGLKINRKYLGKPKK